MIELVSGAEREKELMQVLSSSKVIIDDIVSPKKGRNSLSLHSPALLFRIVDWWHLTVIWATLSYFVYVVWPRCPFQLLFPPVHNWIYWGWIVFCSCTLLLILILLLSTCSTSFLFLSRHPKYQYIHFSLHIYVL